MKRADVKIGVEYCETGALAYGREPAVHPKKIRFTAKEPAAWVHTAKVVQRGEVTRSRLNKSPIKSAYLRLERSGPSQVVLLSELTADMLAEEAARSQPVGATVRYTDRNFDRTYLPCEREALSSGVRWVPGLARPADVHRTWAEYEAQEQTAAERRREQERPRDELQARLDALGLKGIALATGLTVTSIQVSPAQVPAFLKWAGRRQRALTAVVEDYRGSR